MYAIFIQHENRWKHYETFGSLTGARNELTYITMMLGLTAKIFKPKEV